jgi:uncharacterized protein (DUF2147 family)
MRKIPILLFIVFATTIFGINQDNFVGLWKTKEGKSIIKIYKINRNEYAGKIVWLSEPLDENGQPKKDNKNPIENLRDKMLLNLEILKGFHLVKNLLKDGKIYDPKSGKTYSCVIKYKKPNLAIRGFIGISLFGRSETWRPCSKIPE